MNYFPPDYTLLSAPQFIPPIDPALLAYSLLLVVAEEELELRYVSILPLLRLSIRISIFNATISMLKLPQLQLKLSYQSFKVFYKDMHISKQSHYADVYDVDTFNTAFNTEAYRLIKSIEASARYTYASDKPSANPNPYKKQKGSGTDTPTIDQRIHCSGCGKQHKPPCRLTYKDEYNHENKPYAISSKGKAVAARRKLSGREPLKTIVMLYKSKAEVEPADSTPFKPYNQTNSYERGRGRGGHEAGEECFHCNTLSNYLTSVTNDCDNQLIPLSIKVA